MMQGSVSFQASGAGSNQIDINKITTLSSSRYAVEGKIAADLNLIPGSPTATLNLIAFR